MTQYLIGIIIILIIYGIIIGKVHSGRCFRYEYIIKTLIIIGFFIFSFVIFFLHTYVFHLPILVLLIFISFPIIMFFNLKFTIQRFYDLDLSGWYILLKLIPIFSMAVTLYLFFKEGNYGINDYDKAIDYKKLILNKKCINIYDKMFIIDDEEYQYARYLDNYTIKISNYTEMNFFIKYLSENYQIKETQNHKMLEIGKEEFEDIIKKLNLVAILNSFYLSVNKYKIFIRKENFKYTIILDKNINEVTKESLEAFNFPGSFLEDEKFIYYNKIEKNDLVMWVKNVV